MEYCIADSIYHLSNNPKSKVKGWCWASKKTLAIFLGTTPPTVFDNINKLIAKGIIEKDTCTHYLRTTNKWYESVILYKVNVGNNKESLYPKKECLNRVSRNFTHDYKKTLQNNNINKDKYNKIAFSLKKWNENQSSPMPDFKPEYIINKHGFEKIDKLLKKYGPMNKGFSKFLQGLKEDI